MHHLEIVDMYRDLTLRCSLVGSYLGTRDNTSHGFFLFSSEFDGNHADGAAQGRNANYGKLQAASQAWNNMTEEDDHNSHVFLSSSRLTILEYSFKRLAALA